MPVILYNRLTGDVRHIGTRSRSDTMPPAAAKMNDQLSVPVVSAIQPAIIGDIIEPMPKYTVHRPTILPEYSLEK